MKAIVKFTGDEIDVIRGETIDGITYYYQITDDGHAIKFPENRLEFPQLTVTTPPIDWEQRRYEIAKEVLSGLVVDEMPGLHRHLVNAAILYADALIAELKKGTNE